MNPVRFQGLLGIVVILAIAWGLSSNRRKVPWRIIAWGPGLQVVFAIIILSTGPGQAVFELMRSGAARPLSFSDAGGWVPLRQPI